MYVYLTFVDWSESNVRLAWSENVLSFRFDPVLQYDVHNFFSSSYTR